MKIIDPIGAFFCIDFWFSLGQYLVSNRKTWTIPQGKESERWGFRTLQRMLHFPGMKPNWLNDAPHSPSQHLQTPPARGSSWKSRAAPSNLLAQAPSHLAGGEEAPGHPVVGLPLFSVRTCMNNLFFIGTEAGKWLCPVPSWSGCWGCAFSLFCLFFLTLTQNSISRWN